MFKATINTDVLQSSIRAMVALMEECRLDITPDGLSARAVCAANASMCSIDIPAQEFIQFDATDAELGIDLTRFNEILGRHGAAMIKHSEIYDVIVRELKKDNVLARRKFYTMQSPDDEVKE
jgi:DNA polymerase III sliding clamp (beta) subunit (PCNA family)